MKMILTLPSEAGYVPVVRALYATLLERLDVVQEDIDAVCMILTELCSNVVRHANANPGIGYLVEFEYLENRVYLKVLDQGRGFDRTTIPPPDFDQVGGLGLVLVESLADHVEFQLLESGGTAVHASLNIRYRSTHSGFRAFLSEGFPLEP